MKHQNKSSRKDTTPRLYNMHKYQTRRQRPRQPRHRGEGQLPPQNSKTRAHEAEPLPGECKKENNNGEDRHEKEFAPNKKGIKDEDKERKNEIHGSDKLAKEIEHDTETAPSIQYTTTTVNKHGANSGNIPERLLDKDGTSQDKMRDKNRGQWSQGPINAGNDDINNQVTIAPNQSTNKQNGKKETSTKY